MVCYICRLVSLSFRGNSHLTTTITIINAKYPFSHHQNSISSHRGAKFIQRIERIAFKRIHSTFNYPGLSVSTLLVLYNLYWNWNISNSRMEQYYKRIFYKVTESFVFFSIQDTQWEGHCSEHNVEPLVLFDRDIITTCNFYLLFKWLTRTASKSG